MTTSTPPAVNPRSRSEARPRRRDAVENRERLLAAAATAIFRHGHHVPMTVIAADAGVGVGTLYRHYTNREDLVADLQLRAYRMIIAALDEVTAQGRTGLRSLELFLLRTLAHRSQLILPLHGAPVLNTADAADLRRQLRTRINRLLELGAADGTIRQEVEAFDVVAFGSLIAQGLPGTPWEPTARRQLAIFLRGVAATTTAGDVARRDEG